MSDQEISEFHIYSRHLDRTLCNLTSEINDIYDILNKILDKCNPDYNYFVRGWICGIEIGIYASFFTKVNEIRYKAGLKKIVLDTQNE